MDIKIASYEQDLLQKNFWIDEQIEKLKTLTYTKYRNIWMYSYDDVVCIRYKCGSNHGITGSILLDFRGEETLMSVGRFWDNQFTVFTLPYRDGNEWLKTMLMELIADSQPLGHVESIGFDEDNNMGQWFTKCDHFLEAEKPSWIDGDFQFYEIREGFLMIFPDESIRLIDKKGYREFDSQNLGNNLGRQGDVIIIESGVEPIDGEEIRMWSIGRHDVSFDGSGMKLVNDTLMFGIYSKGLITMSHPEHGEFSYRLEGIDVTITITPIPGSSRPFQDGSDESGD